MSFDFETVKYALIAKLEQLATDFAPSAAKPKAADQDIDTAPNLTEQASLDSNIEGLATKPPQPTESCKDSAPAATTQLEPKRHGPKTDDETSQAKKQWIRATLEAEHERLARLEAQGEITLPFGKETCSRTECNDLLRAMNRRRGLEGSGAVISRLPEKAGVKAKEERAHGESGEQCLDGEWEFVGKEEVEEEWTVV